MNRTILILITGLIFQGSMISQNINYTIVDSILLNDKSFEIDSLNGSHWTDLGFRNATPPDIHTPDEVLHRVQLEAVNGYNFIELVTRRDESYEQIGQFIKHPMLKGKKYLLKLSTCHFPGFKGISTSGKKSSFAKPIMIRITAYDFKSNDVTRDSIDGIAPKLLIDSEVVNNTEWEEISFYFEPEYDCSFIAIQAFWDLPVLMAYNGHILIDNLSNIYEIKDK